MKGLVVCLLLSLIWWSPGANARETITIRFEAEVTEVQEFPGVFDLNERVAIGDRIVGSFSYNPDLPATRNPPRQSWGGSIVAWSYTVAGETLSGRRGGISRQTEFPPSSWWVALENETDATFLQNRYVDRTSIIWPTQTQSSSSSVLPRDLSLSATGEFIISFTSGAVGVLVRARLLRLTSAGSSVDGQGDQTVWQARPVPDQAPDPAQPTMTGAQTAALWFDNALETATLSITGAGSEVSLPRLHCGIAGASGSKVWEAAELPNGDQVQWRLDRSALLDGVAGCNKPIGTIAGLRKLAEGRALYVAYEIGGATYRGQLWPRGQLERNGTASALATSAQVVDASESTSTHKVVARLRLNEQQGLGLQYFLDDANAPGRLSGATLHCAPPGAVGPIVAELRTSPNAYWTSLPGSGITSIAANSPCGMEISNSASLIEAYLRGLLYFRLRGTGGEVWRGQALVR